MSKHKHGRQTLSHKKQTKNRKPQMNYGQQISMKDLKK